MAHFAQVNEDFIVTRVIVVNNEDCKDENGNESEAVGVAFCKSLYGDNTFWVKTSYNGNIRYNFASIGYKFDLGLDGFVPPKPYPSWELADNCVWWPPIPMPNDGKEYIWNEETISWNEVAP